MEKKNKNNSSNLLVFGATGLLGGCFIDNYKKIKKIHVAINKTKLRDKKLKSIDAKKIAYIKSYIVKENILPQHV